MSMPSDLDARHGLAEIMQQKALAGADVEHAHARLDAIGRNHRIGNFAPAAVIFVAAIAGLAAAVPIVVVELHRELGDLRLVALGDAREIVALGRFVNEADELTIGHKSLSSRDSPIDRGFTRSKPASFASALASWLAQRAAQAPASAKARRAAPSGRKSLRMMQVHLIR